MGILGKASSFHNFIKYLKMSDITGDVKHDIWIDAYNNDIALFDCGHYHTEKIVVDYIVKVLTANLTGICIQASEACRDVVSYVFCVEEK